MTNANATEQGLQALVAYDMFLKDKGRLYEYGSVEDLDKRIAKEVESKINKLPAIENVTLEDKSVVENIWEAYESLTTAQKEFVSNISVLEKIETKIEELEKEIKTVEDQINELPNKELITLEDREVVDEARQAYESLTEEQKKLVSNLSTLESLENQIVELEKQLEADKAKAQEIDEKIDTLPEKDEVTLQDKESIDQVRQAYEKLTDTQKGFVKNLATLEKLEEKIIELSFEIEKTDEETAVIKEYKAEDKDIVLPEKINNLTVTKIAPNTFKDKEIDTVQLPNTIEEIGEGAFSNNKIKEVSLPETLKRISKNAFSNNEIKNVSISNSVKEIDEGAFANNKIEEIQIPKSVSKIGKSAFKNNRL